MAACPAQTPADAGASNTGSPSQTMMRTSMPFSSLTLKSQPPSYTGSDTGTHTALSSSPKTTESLFTGSIQP